MSDESSFNAKYLELIKDLSAISPSIIMNKDEGKITILRTNKSKSIFFRAICPDSYFQFNGNQIAFNNFAEFYTLLEAFKILDITHDENKIIIENEVGTINYVLANSETLAKSPSKINLDVPEITFNISAVNLSEMKKMNGLINSKYCSALFNAEYKNITLKLYTNDYMNSFDKIFTPETILNLDDSNSPQVPTFDFPIYSEIFSKLPTDQNYKVSIYMSGFISFSFINNEIDFLSGTGKVIKTESEVKSE